ncbi:MAG: LysR family transcriptional regulator [Clostridiales bacterium]|nr:LysR family transcriptional regulator [Clostridiales bacterium]
MTLQQLRYFIEMANTLHYTKAAEQLNISQPSLSYAISQLSITLGVPLFMKEGMQISLTEYGKAFLPYAESALNILSQGEMQLDKMHNPSTGNISLGYIYTVSFDSIPQLIEEFYNYMGNRNINFSFQVNMTNLLIKKLLEGKLDVVMAPYTETANEPIKAIPIFEQELYLIVYNSHSLSSRTSISVEELRDEKFIMINKATDLYLQTANLFKHYNVKPNVFFEVDECNSMASFVGAQLGIAIMPIIPSLVNYKVTAIPFKDKIAKRTVSILWNSQINCTPALNRFLEYCNLKNQNKIIAKKD